MPSRSPSAPRSRARSARPGSSPMVRTSPATAISATTRLAAGTNRAAKARHSRRMTPPSGAEKAITSVERRPPVARDNAAADQIDQMRVHRPSGREAQPRLKPHIEPPDDRIDMSDAGGEAVEDAGLALAAMSDEGADVGLRLGDRRSVRRPIDRVAAAQQFVERGQVGGHVTVRRRYHARRPTHDVVAAKQNSIIRQREAKMVRGMAGGVDRLETPTLAGDGVAVAHGHIRNEVPVPPFLDPGLAAPSSGMRAVTPGRGPGRRLQWRGRRRMVAMGVGDQDVSDPLARETGEQRLDMVSKVGAGVDYRYLVGADDIRSGPSKRERAGVAGDDAVNPRCHRFEPAIFEGEVAAERDVDGHDPETTRDPPLAPGVSVILCDPEGDWSR